LLYFNCSLECLVGKDLEPMLITQEGFSR